MIEVYKKVFKTYPFPIFNDSYLKKTMEENVFILEYLKKIN